MNRRLQEIETAIISRHGAMLNFAEVSHEIGMKNKIAVHAFLEGLPVFTIGKRKRWLAHDIALRILEGEDTQY